MVNDGRAPRADSTEGAVMPGSAAVPRPAPPAVGPAIMMHRSPSVDRICTNTCQPCTTAENTFPLFRQQTVQVQNECFALATFEKKGKVFRSKAEAMFALRSWNCQGRLGFLWHNGGSQ